MFVAEQHLAKAWEMRDAGVPIEEIERSCGGDEIRERIWFAFHSGRFDGKPCTTCNGGMDRSRHDS